MKNNARSYARSYLNAESFKNQTPPTSILVYSIDAIGEVQDLAFVLDGENVARLRGEVFVGEKITCRGGKTAIMTTFFDKREKSLVFT